MSLAYPQAKTIHRVMDNLNIHHNKPLTDLDGAEFGTEIWDRFTVHYTPEPVLEGFDLTIPAGSSLAIVGQNGAGKTTLAKLLCRLYDPQEGAIEGDGVDLRTLDLEGWRARLAAVFQDFIASNCRSATTWRQVALRPKRSSRH